MQIFNIKNCCESRLVSVSKRGHVILKEVSVNRGSVEYLMEIGIFAPAQVLCCKLNVMY